MRCDGRERDAEDPATEDSDEREVSAGEACSGCEPDDKESHDEGVKERENTKDKERNRTVATGVELFDAEEPLHWLVRVDCAEPGLGVGKGAPGVRFVEDLGGSILREELDIDPVYGATVLGWGLGCCQ